MIEIWLITHWRERLQWASFKLSKSTCTLGSYQTSYIFVVVGSGSMTFSASIQFGVGPSLFQNCAYFSLNCLPQASSNSNSPTCARDGPKFWIYDKRQKIYFSRLIDWNRRWAWLMVNVLFLIAALFMWCYIKLQVLRVQIAIDPQNWNKLTLHQEKATQSREKSTIASKMSTQKQSYSPQVHGVLQKLQYIVSYYTTLQLIIARKKLNEST